VIHFPVILAQGPKDVRSLALPAELIFHIDDRILKAIDAAEARYSKAVRIEPPLLPIHPAPTENNLTSVFH